MEGKEEEFLRLGLQTIQIINDDNPALFYYIFIPWKGG